MNPLFIADFNYPLPDERIAKYPLPERDHSKLLIYRDGAVSEDHFYNVGEYINPSALLIYNNTRVIQARLEFYKTTGARIEVFYGGQRQEMARRTGHFDHQPFAFSHYPSSLQRGADG